MQNNESSIWKTGRWPTLLSVFLCFGFSLMVWSVLGPLSERHPLLFYKIGFFLLLAVALGLAGLIFKLLNR